MRAYDRSKLPPQLQNDPRLPKLEADAIAQLQDPKYRWGTCLHEAAHGKYRLQAGAVKLIFLAGHFVYDAAKNQLLTACAGISSEWHPSLKFLDFKDVARYCVAGFLAEELLAGSADAEVGATLDKKVFEDDFRRFHPDVTDAEIAWYWQQAEIEVRKELGDAAIKEEIEGLAKEFEKWLLEG